jgi:hypothetical protein
MQTQYGQADERNFVIRAKNIFLVHIDVKKLMQRAEIAHPPMIGFRIQLSGKARPTEA